MNLDDLLRGAAVEVRDLHLKVGAYPMMRVGPGALIPVNENKRLDHLDTLTMGSGIMTPAQQKKFEAVRKSISPYSVAGLVASLQHLSAARGRWALVLRVIPTKILSMNDLLLPPVLKRIADEERRPGARHGTTAAAKARRSPP